MPLSASTRLLETWTTKAAADTLGRECGLNMQITIEASALFWTAQAWIGLFAKGIQSETLLGYEAEQFGILRLRGKT